MRSKRKKPDVIESPSPFFVRFPPESIVVGKKQWPKLDVVTGLRGSAAEMTAHVEIIGSMQEFQESASALPLLRAFVAAVRIGVYPPIEVLHQLALAFANYDEHTGQRSLDQALGLTRGKGQWTAHGTAKKRMMTRFVATLMYQARLGCRLSIDKAAERVQLALEHHRSFLKLSYTVDTLLKQYPAWRKRFHLNEADTSNLSHPDNPQFRWNDQRRTQFLAPPGYPLF